MTVGVLYPSSNAHPDAGVDFIDGLRAFLKNELPDASIQLMLEGIGFGGAEKEVYSKAEKLLRIERVDVLVAFIDLRVLPILEPLLYSQGKLMIVVNAGANYPYNWVPQPNILFLSLQHAFLCHLTGMLAGSTPSPNAAMATTYYDCGYLHTAAMVNGFVQQGGNITFNFVHLLSYEAFDISLLTTFLEANAATEKLVCIFDDFPAGLFYQHLAATGRAAALKLFVSPMMLEEKAVAVFKNGVPFSVQGHRPWQPDNSSAANQTFTMAYQSFTQKEASVFALLGWETGQILQQIVQQPGNDKREGAIMIETLQQQDWQSPRGTMHLDTETHYLLTSATRCTLQNGAISMEDISLEVIKEQWAAFSAKPVEGVSSGWTNTYLCY